jgi:hypothetical protein
MNTPIDTFDPFASANAPVLPTYDLWGVVEISAFACQLRVGVGKEPWDPNSGLKRFTAIDVFIQSLPEIDVKYPKTLECHWLAESKEWANITLPSIKAAGFDNVREINGKYARVQRVPSGKTYDKKDSSGNPTGEKRDEMTFKFLEFFNSEDECRAAYVAAGGVATPKVNNPTTPTDGQRAISLKFLETIITNVLANNPADKRAAVDTAIKTCGYPPITTVFTIDSPEVAALIGA